MALQGLGVAWVPRLSVTAELARGELVVCGGEHWQVPLEIRLHRCALRHKPAVRRLWKALEEGKTEEPGGAMPGGR
ncbi:HTH domain transcriptional regulator QseD [compost metagenome]